MNIPFLSLKDVNAFHGAEINEAVSHVVNDAVTETIITRGKR